MTLLIAVLVVLGLVARAMTPAERERALGRVLTAFERAKIQWIEGRHKTEPFREALRVRSRWAIATPVLVIINGAVLIWMLRAAGIAGSRDPLEWGANFAPRTTNGEWWRLVTSLFVHSGVVHFAADMIGLIPVGLIMERLIGRASF